MRICLECNHIYGNKILFPYMAVINMKFYFAQYKVLHEYFIANIEQS